MKTLVKTILVIALIVSIVFCIILFVTNERLEEENRQQAEQIQMYDDNAKDLAEALKALRESNNKVKNLEINLNKALKEGTDKDNLIIQIQIELETEKEKNLNLQNEVTRLQGLLENYAQLQDETYEITFYNSSVNIATRAVAVLNPKLTNTETIEVPTRKNFKFVGWALTEGGETIDISTYLFSGNTNLYAQFEQIEYGLFDDNNNVICEWEELEEKYSFEITETRISSTMGTPNALSGKLYIKEGIQTVWLPYLTRITEIKLPSTVTNILAENFEGSDIEKKTIILDSEHVDYSTVFANVKCLQLKKSIIKNDMELEILKGSYSEYEMSSTDEYYIFTKLNLVDFTSLCSHNNESLFPTTLNKQNSTNYTDNKDYRHWETAHDYEFLDKCVNEIEIVLMQSADDDWHYYDVENNRLVDYSPSAVIPTNTIKSGETLQFECYGFWFKIELSFNDGIRTFKVSSNATSQYELKIFTTNIKISCV